MLRQGRLGLAPVLAVAFAACAGPSSAPQPAPAGTASQAPTAAASASAGPSTSASSSAPPPEAPPAGAPFACGPLTCRAFASPEAAFRAVLDESRPLLLAVGEAHAQKGSEGLRSTTARFTDELLPLLDGRASAIVVELWIADGKCGKEKEKQVAAQQKVVTEKQAETNTNEYVVLGEKAKARGIVPFPLRPSCDDVEAVRKAGQDGVLVMLDVITKTMRDRAKALFDETAKKTPGKMVLTYGGALHNDVAPRPGREAWSFAAELEKLAPGRYVELDLVLPEAIKDTESWKQLPWYAAYDAATMGERTVLVTMAPRSFALIYPRSRRTGDAAESRP